MFELIWITNLNPNFTLRLHYDDTGFLISMEASDSGRLFVAVDQLGSPVAVFDSGSGGLVKEISRSPFGRVVADSNPGLDLPVGFAGGVVDAYTGLVHLAGGRVYDPLLGQWMTPDLDAAVLRMGSPYDVFAYRFRNNDPVSSEDMQPGNLMTGGFGLIVINRLRQS